ncbi:acetate--CoA ligase [Candidatus Babeliales bacterium]|nr:acetate--CoA ligase [Candidatus Babeliales bacterium]
MMPALDTRLNSEHFWEQQAEKLAWFKRWDKTLEWHEPYAHWFKGGQLNASYLCVDVHIKNGLGNKVAFHWEDEQGSVITWTYAELYQQVNQYAHLLQKLGVKKNDIVMVYLPMIPQAAAAILAIARLGATHSVVFSGFSSHALKDRIHDTQAKFVITADIGIRRGKTIELKKIVDQAVSDCPSIEKVIIIKRSQHELVLHEGRDIIAQEHLEKNVFVEPVAVESNHPLYILYTSGTTGKPKGLMHSTGGYLTYVRATMQWAFNTKSDSVYWCTADIGWVTGHSYVIYAPLLLGLTSVMYEGAPDFPDPSSWWRLIEKYRVSIFYTSPTAIRMCIKYGDEWPAKFDLSSLKILGTVGEAINPEVWRWYHERIGANQCPIIDTWWQTETGGFLIAPTAGLDLVLLKPGSATLPLPTIEAEVVDAQGMAVPAGTKGYLVIKKPWPGMNIGIYNDPERFKEVYWSRFKGMYYTGDYARVDDDGYFWLLGRADEVVNVAGHRIGTAEIESAAVTLSMVAESAAIGVHDDIKGESIVLFAILKNSGVGHEHEIKQQIIKVVREHIGAFVVLRGVYFVDRLPKTRSGKIMRRLLKAVVEGSAIGDISTLEDGASLEEAKLAYSQLQSIVHDLTF